jgi:hypothetical protein
MKVEHLPWVYGKDWPWTLKFHSGPICLTLLMAVSGVAHLQGGWLTTIFYPFGHPTPYRVILLNCNKYANAVLVFWAVPRLIGSSSIRRCRGELWCTAFHTESIPNTIIRHQASHDFQLDSSLALPPSPQNFSCSTALLCCLNTESL